MTILGEVLIFIVVLIVLIVVHELGHFIVAKGAKMRVDEFGFGYPPRALLLGKIGETEYTLNWLPFGGFVRIYGEDEVSGEDSSRAFYKKAHIMQALVLVAGIVMNIVLAWLLFTVVLVIGTPQELSTTQLATAKNQSIAFDTVIPNSPADKAGFLAGDEIKSATIVGPKQDETYTGTNGEAFSSFVASDIQGYPIRFAVDRNGKMLTLTATPVLNVVPAPQGQKAPSVRPVIGVEVAVVGTVKTPLLQAPWQGAKLTWTATKETFIGLIGFFKGIFTFKANLSEVTGPIGIANAVGQAATVGISSLLLLTGLISINLALINLLPIPALDGGRLLFVIIEAIIRRPLNPRIAQTVNMVGFVLLIVLMLVVSAHDIFVLVH